ncbi:hypothetical protein M408DRAFT_81597 [Serendipita vermifera MAFF 305830]|uniref:Tyrosine--tRNA ligase n=1 Tax=Serendipita vermifera MAFF 305830 TaxID=933852 RepID=A0A0C2W2J1_SERVB|nr:hypothetical protein M408DRAFT_81597 [Serendipita vermifera MAFF 305830]
MRLIRKYATSSKNVYNELKARGMIAQVTRSVRLQKTLETRKITLYAGVDPSAESLHVGNLAVLVTLLHFHLHGHNVIPLIGGATGRVGDPGGRTSERDLMAVDRVERNASSITNQVQHFFTSAAQHVSHQQQAAPTILNNLAWHGSLSLLSFLRFPGKHLRVNALLTRDSVRSRLGSSQGISYAEFSYQLLQAYDFWILHKDHGVELQVGGSDQWGNIISGVELIRRAGAPESELDPAEDTVHGLTIPLLTTSTGEKFGKSAGNAIWLDKSMTSVFDFYQFFLRVSDAEVLPYLKYLTFVPVEEIETLYEEHMKSPEKRVAQQRLASEVTAMIHGVAALDGARLASSVLFDSSPGEHSGSNKKETGRAESILQAIGEHPRLRRASAEEVLDQPVTRVVSKYGLSASHSVAKRLLQSGGLYLNGTRITQLERRLERSDFVDGRVAVLRAGKEEHLILELQ